MRVTWVVAVLCILLVDMDMGQAFLIGETSTAYACCVHGGGGATQGGQQRAWRGYAAGGSGVVGIENLW